MTDPRHDEHVAVLADYNEPCLLCDLGREGALCKCTRYTHGEFREAVDYALRVLREAPTREAELRVAVALARQFTTGCGCIDLGVHDAERATCPVNAAEREWKDAREALLALEGKL